VHIKANSIVGDTIAVSNTMGIYSSDYNSSAIRNTFGKIGSGSDKWRGAIATPSGNVVFIPTANSHFVIYNTNSNTVTSYNSGLPNNLFNHAAILGDDGLIYVATGNAFTGNNFVRFDENTGTVTNVKPANFSPNSYWSAVNLGSGVAFLIPVGNNPTIWDTANGTIYNLTSISLTSLEVLSGAHHPNGNVYFMPFNGNSIIRYNVSSQAITRMPLSGFGGVSGVSGTQKFTSTVMGADQKIYGIPYDQTCNVVLVYDPAANTAFTTNYGVTTFTQDDKFHAGALGSDGRIYMAPYNSSQIVAINTDPNSAQYNTAANVNWGTGPYGSSYSWGVTQGKNNKLVFVPNQSQFIVVGTLPGQPDYNAVLSIYLNKTA
jgi:hypothetical protein